MIEYLRPYIISLVIGFLIGLERERSHGKAAEAIGMRTIVLFALLGTLAAEINTLAITLLLSAFVFGAILLGYFRSTKHKRKLDVGLTTETAGAVVFCLGYLAFSKPILAAALGVAVLVILFGKERLHKFARQQIKTEELQAAITIVFIGIAVLPFLPNETIDPWALFNPRRFGMLVLLLALIQFSGYVAIRVFGRRLGIVMLGFFGGLVSSTAVFATIPKMSQDNPALSRSLVTGALFSIIGMLVVFLIVVAMAAPSLISHVIWPVTAMMAVGASSALLVFRPEANTVISQPSSPLDIKSVLYLACFIGAMIVLASLAGHFFGTEGISIVSFIGALFEMHGVSLATATLFFENKLDAPEATHILMLVVLASFVSKFVLLWGVVRNVFALWVSVYMVAMIAVGFGVYSYL